MTPAHVLIVGGGLAGPALALALARKNIRSTIFELRPSRSDSGGSISLAPNALNALDRGIGVYDGIRSAGFTYHRIGAYADDGYKFGEIRMCDEEPGSYPLVRVMRSAIHKVLLDACAERDAVIKVVWGATFTKIQENQDRVTVIFEDGSSATGDILIGADGIHSKVREHLLRSLAPTPTYIGACVVASLVPLDLVTTPPDFAFPAMILSPVGFIMGLPIDPEGKTIAWGSSEDLKESKGREGWREYEVSGEAARVTKAHYAHVTTQPIRSLLDNIDDTKARVWAPYEIPDLPTWHGGRVCLIGDAAHALPPNGQGSAQAFEDATFLARLLGSEAAVAQGYDKLFGHFERARRQRIDYIKVFSKKTGGRFRSASGPWMWWLKKWMFYLYFAWNGFVLSDTKLTGYDVMDEDIVVK